MNTKQTKEDLFCPQCHSKNFDGWDCKDCGYALPQKQRKMFGKKLTDQEAEELRKRLGVTNKE